MKKKIISILLICSMLFTILPTGAAFAEDELLASGTSDDGLTWEVTTDGVLTISGQGPMKDYIDCTTLPWYNYGDNLKEVIVKPGVTTIGCGAFYYLDSLEKATLPDSITSIGKMAFSYCKSLKEITIPKNVQSIGDYAFQSCSSLESLNIPASVEFFGCGNSKSSTALTEFIVDSGNQYYTARDGVLYTKDMTKLISYPSGKTDTIYVAPVSLNTIGKDAITKDDDLTDIYLGPFVNQIEEYGIAWNKNVKNIYFYGDAPEIYNKSVFYSPTPLQSLYYIDGKSGWTTPLWNDYPTATWEGADHYSTAPEETIIIGTSPVDGATNVGYDAADLPEFHIQFNKVPATMNGAGVQIDASKEPFAIYRATDDKLIWKDPSSGAFSTNMVINTDNTIVTVTPTNAHTLLEKDTVYYITMGEGYIKFADGTTSPAIEKWEWSFKTKNPDESIVSDITIKTGDTDTKNAVVEVEWKDSWFDNSSNYYMHDLATASMALSGASYVEKSGIPASEKIQAALTAFGFSDFQSFNYDVERAKLDNDMVSYSFAAKQVEDNGTAYTLVAVVVKGTSGDEEWYSNFNIGQGSQHEGFRICAEDVMNNLEQYVENLGLGSYNAKFLVTGHSRGAAVANLVAKEITDSSFAQTRNVYGYTFATPAVVTDSNASKYNNIFNIVNGEDFVTRVPLVAWNYKRYGIDLLLPSRSYYGEGYNDIYTAMSAEYCNLVHKGFEPYNGTQQVDKLITNVISLAPNVKEFYENKNSVSVTPYDYFNSLAEFLVTENPLLLGAYSISDEYVPITAFFVANQVVDQRVFGAHSMATYYSWMDSCSAEELFGNANESTKRWFKRAIVACPVDVYVYDEAGNLVASVVDETVGTDTLAVNVEEGVKTIDLPDDQEYDIKIVAREAGTVSYNIEEYQATADGDEEQRMVGFDDIAIASGDELSGNVDAIRHTDSENYALTKNNSETIHADYDSDAKIETISMHRLYNPNSGEHFYTGSIEERDMLVNVGWQYEGVAWNAPTQTGDPVYRLFNPNNGDHHYTMSAEERDNLVAVGWRYEGVCWNSASPENLPLYRLYNPNADCGSHHYTGSTEERDYLVSLGWHFEGIGWFGMLN